MGLNTLEDMGIIGLVGCIYGWLIYFLTTGYHQAVKLNARPIIKYAYVLAILPTYLVVMYGSINIIIPSLVAILTGYILYKYTNGIIQWYIPAIAVQVGQAAWFGIALLLLAPNQALLFEFIIFSIGIFFLSWKPGLPIVAMLCTYQALAFIVNFINFISQPIFTEESSAFSVHLCLRILAIVFMLIGFKQASIVKNSKYLQVSSNKK